MMQGEPIAGLSGRIGAELSLVGGGPGLTRQQLDEIGVEGAMKDWPLPAPP